MRSSGPDSEPPVPNASGHPELLPARGGPELLRRGRQGHESGHGSGEPWPGKARGEGYACWYATSEIPT
ncbi:hypothetical protein GCM10010300_56060 [Streptomyces olivaceoviridis]|nr:hypothetical protein GCM10010300_56060 [Streptomyces olivaceoviridis]